MLRPSRPLLSSLFTACLLAAPALACAQGYDPARVQSISDPRFQNQIMQSSQAVAEALVGRRANSTDQEILRKFAGQQSSFLRTLENAARAMPQNGNNGYGNSYDSGNGYDGRGMSSADLQAIAELSRTPEGRRVLEQLTNQRYNNANSGYDSGYNGYQQQGGYPQNNQQKPAQVLRDALLQDLTNAASNAAYGQPVYRGNGVHP
ncbi:hypothetical protein [Lysobacter sp. Root690]|uniref:hypothetical protein n=1 Tax=Lysobacter sp. Root690 TaxID=1736588 RepID=UPI000B0A4DFF|nr:hypothetical protein [Lysobacter sp. Root690]